MIDLGPDPIKKAPPEEVTFEVYDIKEQPAVPNVGERKAFSK